MPTKNRLRFLPRAIRCFQAQTYANRELLILDDGDERTRDHIPKDSRIRYVRCGPTPSLGCKRNLAIERARGEFIAHWDDDDWSDSERLRSQIELGAAVSGYRRMLFWNERDGVAQVYSGSENYVLGTSLCYRRDWWQTHRFNRKDVGEDNDFVKAARRAGALQVTDGLGLMVATTHRNGTSPRCIDKRRWVEVAKEEIPEDYWTL